jgi:hypothetical protein
VLGRCAHAAPAAHHSSRNSGRHVSLQPGMPPPTSSRRAGSRFISRSLNHSIRANAAFLSSFKFGSRNLSYNP